MRAAAEMPWLDIYAHMQVNVSLKQYQVNSMSCFINVPIKSLNLTAVVVPQPYWLL